MQLVDEEPHGVLDPQVVRDLARDRHDRERQAIAIDECLALGTEEFRDDELARADCGLVEAHRDDAAAVSERDARSDLLGPAYHANRALCRLRVDLCANSKFDGAADSDDLVGSHVNNRKLFF
jgi:hypothetical protein